MTALEHRWEHSPSQALAGDDLEAQIMAALDTVVDPELDEPITDLKFVRSVTIDDDGVEVHLRLPTSFCSPNFAYLMASDSVDALELIDGIGVVRVYLDDHHDSEKINAGLAARAGYRGTFGHEALESLDSLRETFHKKAHTAAMERSLARLIAAGAATVETIGQVLMRDLPDDETTAALRRRRNAIGLSQCMNARVLVNDDGTRMLEDEIPMRLRFARSVRISIDGNSHFCRGLLATRYADDGDGAVADGPRITNVRH
ncbi:iron-sulfur cluster assembly protein [Gordonia sp. (in: high G+C Gram-positive bacteria)]|uniref:iron-sulfur cluster assembly protein n=1 Tax=Gordonia sp. (in: high G+C Gram-positive bacteria) TaxID=84139 RepID=UPI0016A7E2F1|nr:iron-sulfur cluster assembly protein [Gordonia sp. (in: high G+C Gram-positive bacteria)]NLG45250.1 iron-sulfur cluster assembly protein [Gordonia sp. (in: high G+C Gram-positive bacteria)]